MFNTLIHLLFFHKADGFARPLRIFQEVPEGLQKYIFNSSESYIKLSAKFIDKYMPSADGTFVKVYLLGLKQCGERTPLDSAGLASVLDILESDVLRAWKYWEKCGVVRLEGTAELTVTFLSLDEPVREVQHVITPQKPSYSSSEIAKYASDHAEMRELLRHAEKVLQKSLSSNDQSTIFGFHDWLGLPVEVISLLLTYCASVNKKSMRSIELMAISWSEQGINSLEKAEQYLAILQENNSKINSYKRAIGIFGRVLTKAELDYLSNWAYKLSSPIELVKLAAEITALNTGKTSLPYMNTMLQEWYSKGIKTAADARAMRNEFKNKTAAVNSGGKSKFSDYSMKTTYDYEAIEQAALNFKKKRQEGDK